jgi:hypothetical protein
VRADVFVYDERARQNPLASLVGDGAVDAVADVDGITEVAGVGITGFVATVEGVDEDVVLIAQPPGGPMAPADIADGRPPRQRGEALVAAGFGADVGVGTTITYEGGQLTVVGTAGRGGVRGVDHALRHRRRVRGRRADASGRRDRAGADVVRSLPPSTTGPIPPSWPSAWRRRRRRRGGAAQGAAVDALPPASRP